MLASSSPYNSVLSTTLHIIFMFAMEYRTNVIRVLVVALVAVTLVAAVAAVPASAGSCSGTLSALSVCLPAVEGDNPPSPTDACCAIVRSTDTSCLCSIISAYSNSMGVNMHASLLLPKECKKIVPSGYSCDGFTIPSFVPQNRKLMSV